MYYECECGQIYCSKEDAENCCPPEVTPVMDHEVVYCWRCKGDGCKECHDTPLRRKRTVQERWDFSQRAESPTLSPPPAK